MSDFLAIWGAALATALAALRGVEFWRDRRPHLKIDYILRSDARLGNDVLLINNSPLPASIYRLHVVWAKRRWFGPLRPLRVVFDNDDDFLQVTVPPHGTKKLHFAEAAHFPMFSQRQHHGAILYGKLWIVGRDSPLWVRISR